MSQAESPLFGDALLKTCLTRLAEGRGVVRAGGLWGSSAPMVIAAAAGRLARPMLYVCPGFEHADRALDDFELFAGRAGLFFPAWDGAPGEGGAAGEIEAERLRVLSSWQVDGENPSDERLARAPRGGRSGKEASFKDLGPRGLKSTARQTAAGAETSRRLKPVAREGQPLAEVVFAPIQALMQAVPSPKTLRGNLLAVKQGDRLKPETLLEWALTHGYERLELVESPGDVARRGDIMDLFPPGAAAPIRVDFFGDEIESIRSFDVVTHRSKAAHPSLSLPAARIQANPEAPGVETIAAFLPRNTLVVLEEPSEIQHAGELYRRHLVKTSAVFPVTDILAALADFSQLHLSHVAAPTKDDPDAFSFPIRSLARFEVDAEKAVAELCRLAADHEVFVYSATAGEQQRLREMIARQTGEKPPPRLRLELGLLHRGFEWMGAKTLLVGQQELFHREQRRGKVRRHAAGRAIDSWADLAPGELVVHQIHGIAAYRGLKTMAKSDAGKIEEFLELEFDDDATIYVPASQIELVQKYVGVGGARPRLSTLGGKRWARTKEKVAEAVEKFAESLLRVQAIRENTEGTAYPADTAWQNEFEGAFPFQETEDQLIVAREIKEDLSRTRPMDRLICGDVGYGKTELAMRAAFKVMEYGRQVGVLVPTTVLAEQHYESFRARFAEYPFSIGCLSRFRSNAEQKEIIDRAKKGRIDLVIGTHRILSKDVGFANLGLVIVDEEQRFGVEHKEHLKSLREVVDILTLSATPIPRTLHMAMTGIRDISTLQTPPVDRRSIVTTISPFTAEIVREAIHRELDRGGQVFFVHNFVRSIHAVADRIRDLIPDARIVVGHGQMPEKELEDVMFTFAHGEAEIFVSTNIIGAGIDIPRANTIFIDRADRFGLADLHQLRGRVGRSAHRGYCYLLIPENRPLPPKAIKRLKAVEEFSELGAGFRIAMRDLEIRGAGNILGAEQSGNIVAVGYELYCRLLDHAVRKIKNEPIPEAGVTHVEIEVDARLPADYITADKARMEVYRRLATAGTLQDVQQLSADLIDAFGPPPPVTQVLLQLAEIRVLAGSFSIRSIVREPPDVIFRFEKMTAAQPFFQSLTGTVRMPDASTAHWRPPPRYLEPGTLVSVLRNALARARQEATAATV